MQSSPAKRLHGFYAPSPTHEHNRISFPGTPFPGHQLRAQACRDYIRLGTTGGSHAPGNPMAIDHVSLVTVSGDGVDIAKLRMSGIFDKTGKVPLNGDEICLEECANK